MFDLEFGEFELGWTVSYRTLKLTTILGEHFNLPADSRAGDWFYIPYRCITSQRIPDNWGAPKRYAFTGEALVHNMEPNTSEFGSSRSFESSQSYGDDDPHLREYGDSQERWNSYTCDDELHEEVLSEDGEEESLLPQKRPRQMPILADQGRPARISTSMELRTKGGYPIPIGGGITYDEDDEEPTLQNCPRPCSDGFSGPCASVSERGNVSRLSDEDSSIDVRIDQTQEQENTSQLNHLPYK